MKTTYKIEYTSMCTLYIHSIPFELRFYSLRFYTAPCWFGLVHICILMAIEMTMVWRFVCAHITNKKIIYANDSFKRVLEKENACGREGKEEMVEKNRRKNEYNGEVIDSKPEADWLSWYIWSIIMMMMMMMTFVIRFSCNNIKCVRLLYGLK